MYGLYPGSYANIFSSPCYCIVAWAAISITLLGLLGSLPRVGPRVTYLHIRQITQSGNIRFRLLGRLPANSVCMVHESAEASHHPQMSSISAEPLWRDEWRTAHLGNSMSWNL